MPFRVVCRCMGKAILLGLTNFFVHFSMCNFFYVQFFVTELRKQKLMEYLKEKGKFNKPNPK